MRKTKYYNVIVIQSTVLNDKYTFDCCRDAAYWLHNVGISASVNAARVGMSGVLTGKRVLYRGMSVTADRRY